MTADEETYTAIYAVTELSTRTALLRIFGQYRMELNASLTRIEMLEADAGVAALAMRFGRWAGPMIVAIALAIVTLVLGK